MFMNGNRKTMAEKIAEKAGFQLWELGGGCEAFAIEIKTGEMADGSMAMMDLMVTANEGDNVGAQPSDPVWTATVNFQDSTRNDTVLTSEDNLTLDEAIAEALEFAKRADELWDDEFKPEGTTTPSL